MDKYAVLIEEAQKNNGLMTLQMARRLGIPPVYLSQAVKRGWFQKYTAGLYVLADHFDDDTMYFFHLRHPQAIYSLHSALYLHGLSDQIPETREITLPKGYNPYRLSKSENTCHFSEKNLYTIGRMTAHTIFGNPVTVYDMERTLCDLVRNHDKIEREVFLKAFRLYFENPARNTKRLTEYARYFHIEERMAQYIEMLS